MSNFLNTAEHKNTHTDYRRAKMLRQNSSLAERILWKDLRLVPRESGLKFRRQHPIQPYVVDFVCLKARLVVEIDGWSHDSRQENDRFRSDYLQAMGYIILRFTNDDVYRDGESVVQTIVHQAQKLLPSDMHPSPNPSHRGRGIEAL